MAFKMINVSPVIEDVPLFSFDMINNMAPPIPRASPAAFAQVIFSFNIQKASKVINNGVHSINKEA